MTLAIDFEALREANNNFFSLIFVVFYYFIYFPPMEIRAIDMLVPLGLTELYSQQKLLYLFINAIYQNIIKTEIERQSITPRFGELQK